MPHHPRPDRSAPPRMASYEEERATWRIDVPERFNPVIDIVERWAAEAPDDLALVSLGPEGETVAEQTVDELARESRRAARALLEQGIRPGDRVFIMLGRGAGVVCRHARASSGSAPLRCRRPTSSPRATSPIGSGAPRRPRRSPTTWAPRRSTPSRTSFRRSPIAFRRTPLRATAGSTSRRSWRPRATARRRRRRPRRPTR